MLFPICVDVCEDFEDWWERAATTDSSVQIEFDYEEAFHQASEASGQHLGDSPCPTVTLFGDPSNLQAFMRLHLREQFSLVLRPLPSPDSSATPADSRPCAQNSPATTSNNSRSSTDAHLRPPPTPPPYSRFCSCPSCAAHVNSQASLDASTATPFSPPGDDDGLPEAPDRYSDSESDCSSDPPIGHNRTSRSDHGAQRSFRFRLPPRAQSAPPFAYRLENLYYLQLFPEASLDASRAQPPAPCLHQASPAPRGPMDGCAVPPATCDPKCSHLYRHRGGVTYGTLQRVR